MNSNKLNNSKGSRLMDPDSGYVSIQKLSTNWWIVLISFFVCLMFFVLTAISIIEHGKITRAVLIIIIPIIENNEFSRPDLFALIRVLSKHGEFTKLGFATLIFLFIMFIRTYLHEMCHKFCYETLSGKKAKIQWISLTPNCRFDEMPTSIYVIVCLASLIATAGTGLVFAIVFLTHAIYWIQATVAFSTLFAFIGSSMDIYYAVFIFKYPRDYLVYDNGTCAEIFAPKK